MSELAYTLPLTERERTELFVAALVRSSELQREHLAVASQRLRDLAAKLDALEPIGTGGTTEGA